MMSQIETMISTFETLGVSFSREKIDPLMAMMMPEEEPCESICTSSVEFVFDHSGLFLGELVSTDGASIIWLPKKTSYI